MGADDGPSPARTAPWMGRWRRYRPELLLLGLFVASDLAFSAASNAIAHFGLGVPYLGPHAPDAAPNLLDALWHVVTGLLLAWPLRDRRALVLLPALTLLLDVDHLFGALWPVAVPRPAHDLLFFALVSALLAGLLGARAAGLALGASLLHVAVDGGSFPLLAPVQVGAYGLSLGGELLFLVAAAVCLAGLATPGPARRWSSWTTYLPWVVAIVGLGLTLALVGPTFGTFTRA